jgi:ribosomal protein S18 acetylase RimI-like enzyme
MANNSTSPLSSATETFRIREIDPKNEEDKEAITRLHMELLCFGPIAQLGALFLKQFCYDLMIREKLLKGALYEVDSKPVGFIVYTDRSITFHRTALRKHWLYVCFLIVWSLVQEPKIIFRLWRAIQLMFSRREDRVLGEDPMAEIVAIGVRPEYRDLAFIRRTGRRIAHELFEYASNFFREVGLKGLHLVVDADNKQALLFYNGLGARFERCQFGGKPSVRAWLDLTE